MINRRDFLKYLMLVSPVALSGCGSSLKSLAMDGFLYVSPLTVGESDLSLFQRSTIVKNKDGLDKVLSKANLIRTDDPELNDLKILHLKGTPEEMGLQHGSLLRKEVHSTIKMISGGMNLVSAEEDSLYEAYNLMSPHIPVEESEEMTGLAHGSGLKISSVHDVHAFPEIVEYKDRKRFSIFWDGVESCSGLAARGAATSDGEVYHLRVLDWWRKLGVQKHPLILAHEPDRGNASVSFSYSGFMGCVTGMNDKHLALGEMGFGDFEKFPETLRGTPFPFLFRKVLREADTMDQAIEIMRETPRTCSYVYVVSDSKQKGKEQIALVVSNARDFDVYRENTRLTDPRDGFVYPGIENVVYGSHHPDRMLASLEENPGSINEKTLMEMSQKVAMRGNIQNVIFKPSTFDFWVTNARDSGRDMSGAACNQKWFHGNLENILVGGDLSSIVQDGSSYKTL